jgi:hypothetical protein
MLNKGHPKPYNDPCTFPYKRHVADTNDLMGSTSQNLGHPYHANSGLYYSRLFSFLILQQICPSVLSVLKNDDSVFV